LTLHEEEDEYHWESGEGGTSHDLSPGRGVPSLELRQAKRQGKHLLGRGHQPGPEEIIPDTHKSEDDQGSDARQGEGEDDTQEDLEFIAAINAGGVQQFVGDGVHELPHEEDAENAGDLRDDEGSVAIQPFEGIHDAVEGNQVDLKGNHQPQQQDEKDFVASGKMQFSEGISCQRVEEDVSYCGGSGNKETVEQVARKGDTGEDVKIVFDGKRVGYPLGRVGEDKLLHFQGGADHPVEREQHQQGGGC